MSGPARFLSAGLATIALLVAASVVCGDDPPTKPERPPVDNPISRFLNRVFEDAKNAQPPTEAPNEAVPRIQPATRIIPDAIDERAAAGRDQQRTLVLAQRLIRNGDRVAGVGLVQELLNADEDTLIMSADGEWQSLQQVVEGVLQEADPEFRREYVERFGPVANEQLRLANQSMNLRNLARVAKRFLFTPAGRQAALTLANVFRDTGNYVETAYWSKRHAMATGQPSAPEQRVPQNVVTIPATEWLQPFGGPTHHRPLADSDPVLVERWSQPAAARPAVAEQVDWLIRDLVDTGRACIPAAIPLVVDGKILTRTLRGVAAYDSQTGRLLWESDEGVSVERLLSGDIVPRPGGEPTSRNVRPIPEYRGSNPDGHPLAGLLFRDGVYGLISSDGEQVFVLENHASLSYRQPGYFWGQRVQDDPFGRDWSTNELVAYDIETGTVRWRIGGPRWEEPFDLPLAGTLFLGPPVIDGEEMFLIGERGSTMTLFVLDRTTGNPLWSHDISYVGSQIEQDLVRRWWPAQPAVGRGVIVCPTTSGWLVAVDRLQRRIRWTYRYIESRQKKVRSNRPRVASAGPLNTRWSPSAPVMTQRHVIVTPQELPDPLYGDQPRVVCLDLLSGERVWWEEKGTAMYLGGATDDRVVLVGKESIEAWEIATEKRLWSTPLQGNRIAKGNEASASTGSALLEPGPPSGRGIIAGDEYLLPLQSGQLWFIGLADGKVRRTLSLRADARPLGNLLIDNGRLISAGPHGVKCFEKRAAISAEQKQTEDGPVPATARLRMAELQFLEGRLTEAKAILDELDSETLPRLLKENYAELRWDTHLQLVRQNLSAADDAFAELTALATTRDERLTVERIRAERLLARGDTAAAFDAYWKLAEQPRRESIRDERTSLRFDRWLAGKLKTVYHSAQGELRDRIHAQLALAAESAVDADEQSRRWWADVLRFHPAGMRVRREVAWQALENDERTLAETTLLQLMTEAEEAELRLWAFDRLLRMLIATDRGHDAVAYIDDYADHILGADNLLTEYFDKLPEGVRLPLTAWSDGPWKVTRSPASFNRSKFDPQLAIVPGLPSVSALKLRVEPNLHRLAVARLSGEMLWELPLRAQPQSFYNQTTAVGSIGQLLLVVHRGVLHAVSIADRELLWRRGFDVQSAAAGYVRSPSLARHQELKTLSSFLWGSGLRQSQSPLGMLAVCRPGYVAYFGRHTITVADPLTGETFWSREGIPPRTMVYGTDEELFVVPPEPDDAYALSILDGSHIDMPRLNGNVKQAIALNDRGLVLIEQRRKFRLFGRGESSLRLRLVDPRGGAEKWDLELSIEARLAQISDDEILAVEPEGTIRLIDCREGNSRMLGTIDLSVMDGLQRAFVVADTDRMLLAFNKPPNPGTYSQRYQSTPVHGMLACLDRKAGLLWTQEIVDQSLIVDQLPHLPVYLFAAKRRERRGDVSMQQLAIELRDKETGELLLKEDRFISGVELREMEVNHAAQHIDLKTYGDRLRLQVTGN